MEDEEQKEQEPNINQQIIILQLKEAILDLIYIIMSLRMIKYSYSDKI